MLLIGICHTYQSYLIFKEFSIKNLRKSLILCKQNIAYTFGKILIPVAFYISQSERCKHSFHLVLVVLAKSFSTMRYSPDLPFLLL